MPDEADPVGLISCSDKNDAVVKYATGGINTQVFASQYLAKSPDESLFVAELDRTGKLLKHRSGGKPDAGTRGD